MNKFSDFASTAMAVICLLVTVQSARAAGSFEDNVAKAKECGVLSESIESLSSAIRHGTLSEGDGSSLLLVLLHACEAKLPIAPFEDKLAEGMTKHVAPPLIVRVLEQKLGAYTFANTLLEGHLEKVAPDLLVVVGEGIFNGTPRQDFDAYVSEYFNQAPEPFLTGAHMVALLGQEGFDYGLTRSMLEAGFVAGGPSPQWRYVIRLVLIARQRGVPDAAIAKAAAQVLTESGSPNDVAARLGFTSRSLTGRAISN